VVTSWERDLSYPQELKPFISTTNALERFTKEVQRRSKVLSPSLARGRGKGAPYGHREMNESSRERILPNWHLSTLASEKMRKEGYGTGVRSEEALVEV